VAVFARSARELDIEVCALQVADAPSRDG
jgi:hypothetical protein